MIKASVLPAAALAAVFFCSAAAPAEAAGKPASRTAQVSRQSPKKAAVRKKSTPRKKAARKTDRKKARRVVRQDARGAVVVERVALQTAQFYGPFLPVERYDFPQPPCAPMDTVIAAYVHETDAETPETDDVGEVAAAPHPNALARVARTLGSLLRPKSAQTTLKPEDVDLSDLLSAGIQIPVEGVDASRLRDSFLSSRGRHAKHLAIDIGAPRGTPVVAAAAGEVMMMRREKRGGITVYQKDPSGRYLLFYCHLSKYAKGLRAGDKVARGQVLGYVGSTGRVIGGPHLHFSITRLPDDESDNFRAGVAVNPYLLFLATVP